MLTLSPAPPATSGNEWLQFMKAWLEVVKDPDTFQERLAQLGAEELKAAQRLEQATAKEREVTALKGAHEARITKERAQHNAEMQNEREKFNQLCQTGMAEVKAAREEAANLKAQAQADADAAAKLKADLDARIAIIKRAGL